MWYIGNIVTLLYDVNDAITSFFFTRFKSKYKYILCKRTRLIIFSFLPCFGSSTYPEQEAAKSHINQ